MKTSTTSRASLFLAALFFALAPVVSLAADGPAVPTVPPPAEKLAVEARWNKYKTIRDDIAWYRVSPEEGALLLTKLADDSKGTELEPILRYHVAAIRFQLDDLVQAKALALDVKTRFPNHYLCTNKLPAFEKSQVDQFLLDVDSQAKSRADVPIVIPKPEPDASPRVVLETTNGRIEIAFFAKEAPKHVENFLKNVESGLYDGTDVFQVHPGTRLLLGDAVGAFPKPTDRRIAPEINVIPHARGAVAMFYIDPQAGDDAKQFCICFGHPAFLDLESTVFGRVVEGMDVVDTVASAPVDKQGYFPLTPVKILKASILR